MMNNSGVSRNSPYKTANILQKTSDFKGKLQAKDQGRPKTCTVIKKDDISSEITQSLHKPSPQKTGNDTKEGHELKLLSQEDRIQVNEQLKIISKKTTWFWKLFNSDKAAVLNDARVELELMLKRGEGKVGTERLLDPEWEGLKTQIEGLPKATNYADVPRPVINNARQRMNNFFDSLGRKQGMGIPCKGKEKYSNWAIDITKIKDDKTYALGDYELLGAEIKDLIASTKVTYNLNRVSAQELEQILTHGTDLDYAKQYLGARGRCVKSQIPLAVDQKFNSIKRKVGDPIETFGMYTMNGTNVGYGSMDKALYLDNAGKKLEHKEAYKEDLKSLLAHYLLECHDDKVDIPVIPGFAMGIFAGESKELKQECYAAFAEALKELMESDEFKKYGFKQVIFADPNPDLYGAVSGKRIPGLHCCQKSGLDVTQAGVKNGFKMAFLNPGDPRGYPGENWEHGHFALEEMIALVSLLVLAQNANICPQIRDSSTYIPRVVSFKTSALYTTKTNLKRNLTVDTTSIKKTEDVIPQLNTLAASIESKKKAVGKQLVKVLNFDGKDNLASKNKLITLIEDDIKSIKEEIAALRKANKKVGNFKDRKINKQIANRLDQMERSLNIDLVQFFNDFEFMKKAISSGEIINKDPLLFARNFNWFPNEIIELDQKSKFRVMYDLAVLDKALTDSLPLVEENDRGIVGMKYFNMIFVNKLSYLCLKDQMDVQKEKYIKSIIANKQEDKAIEKNINHILSEIDREIFILNKRLNDDGISKDQKKAIENNIRDLKAMKPIPSFATEIPKLLNNKFKSDLDGPSEDVRILMGKYIDFMPNEVVSENYRAKYQELNKAMIEATKNKLDTIQIYQQIQAIENFIATNLQLLSEKKPVIKEINLVNPSGNNEFNRNLSQGISGLKGDKKELETGKEQLLLKALKTKGLTEEINQDLSPELRRAISACIEFFPATIITQTKIENYLKSDCPKNIKREIENEIAFQLKLVDFSQNKLAKNAKIDEKTMLEFVESFEAINKKRNELNIPINHQNFTDAKKRLESLILDYSKRNPSKIGKGAIEAYCKSLDRNDAFLDKLTNIHIRMKYSSIVQQNFKVLRLVTDKLVKATAYDQTKVEQVQKLINNHLEESIKGIDKEIKSIETAIQEAKKEFQNKASKEINDRINNAELTLKELQLLRNQLDIDAGTYLKGIMALKDAVMDKKFDEFLKQYPGFINRYISLIPDHLINQMELKYLRLRNLRDQILMLPPALHYSDFDRSVINARRDDMYKFLDDLGRKVSTKSTPFRVDGRPLDWSIDLEKVDDKRTYKLGGRFELTGNEIKTLVNSTKVTYRSDGTKLTSDTLNKLLTTGADPTSLDEVEMAEARSVSSDIPIVVDQNGNTIERKTGNPPPTFRIYTMNAPDLLTVDFNTSEQGKYKKKLTAILSHHFSDCRRDKIEVPVIPGFGMGVFADKDKTCYTIFAEVLNELSGKYGFTEVIFADPNPVLAKAVIDKKTEGSIVSVCVKSGLDVILEGHKRGVENMSFLNPGDPSCCPGQNWEKGHFALEEMLGLFSLLVLTQHPNVCKNVSDKSKYRALTDDDIKPPASPKPVAPSAAPPRLTAPLPDVMMANTKALDRNPGYVAFIQKAKEEFSNAKTDLLSNLKVNLEDKDLSDTNKKKCQKVIKALESDISPEILLIFLKKRVGKFTGTKAEQAKLNSINSALSRLRDSIEKLDKQLREWTNGNFDVFSEALIKSIPNAEVKPSVSSNVKKNDQNNNGLKIREQDLTFTGEKETIRKKGKTTELRQVSSAKIKSQDHKFTKPLPYYSEGLLYFSGEDALYHDHIITSKSNEPPMITLCDGSGHGRLAAATAINTAEIVSKKVAEGIKKCTSLHDVLRLQLKALKEAKEVADQHAGISSKHGIEYAKDQHLSTAATTFIQTTVVGKYLTGVVVGDSKVYVFREKKGGGSKEWTVIDPLGNAKGSLDAAESGGQISGTEVNSSDLHKTKAFVYPLEPGDVVYVCSDGVIDNFDPSSNNITPKELNPSIKEDEWEYENSDHIAVSMDASKKAMEEAVKGKSGDEIMGAIANYVDKNTEEKKIGSLTNAKGYQDLNGKLDDAAAGYFIYKG